MYLFFSFNFIYYIFKKSKKNSFYYLINQLLQINFNENIIYTTELTQLYILEYDLSFSFIKIHS